MLICEGAKNIKCDEFCKMTCDHSREHNAIHKCDRHYSWCESIGAELTCIEVAHVDTIKPITTQPSACGFMTLNNEESK